MSGQLVKKCTGCGTQYEYALRECPACGSAGYSARRAAAVVEAVGRPMGEPLRKIRGKEARQAAETGGKGTVIVLSIVVLLLALVLIGLALSQGGKAPTPPPLTEVSSAPPVPPTAAPMAQPPQNSAGGPTELSWGDLHRGRWPMGDKPWVVPAITGLVGKRVQVRGFLLPLHEAQEASEFFLAASPGGCFFCNPPAVSDVVMLVTPEGKKLPLTGMPVMASGVLHVATGDPNDEALYVLRDMSFVEARSPG